MSIFPSAGYSSNHDGSVRDQFPDPFHDVASTHMPTSMTDVLKWAEYVWINQGTYKAAMERVVAYFLTELDLVDAAEEQKKKYLDFLNNDLDIMGKLRILGLDFLCYGNSFSSVYIPFIRTLICPKCVLMAPMDKFNYKFESFKFHAECPKCKYVGIFDHKDHKVKDESKVQIIRWNPHTIRLQFHPFSHEVEYLWKIPKDLCNFVKKGEAFYLEHTPWEVIEAIRDEAMFKFAPGVIYHMKEETLAGVENRGWGLPRSLHHFKQAWYVQVLKRYNEAIALDYIIPFRVITPAGGNSKAADPFVHTNLGTFTASVQNMLARRRRDPATWNVLPFPVDYRALGGEGIQLAPVDLLAQGTEELLNSAGVPVDFYKGTLQTQAAPMALRLFQQTWPHFVSACNGWISWLLKTMRGSFQWTDVKGKLRPVTLADDMERRSVLLQLAAGRQISLGSALSAWGLNLQDEVKEIYNEQRLLANEEKEFNLEQQKAMELEQQLAAPQGPAAGPGGGMPPGGMAGGGMPPMGGMAQASGSVSVGDLMGQAEETASRLLAMPYEMRRKELLNIKKTNPTLHALVKANLESARSEGASQGRMMVSQGGAGGPPPMGPAM